MNRSKERGRPMSPALPRFAALLAALALAVTGCSNDQSGAEGQPATRTAQAAESLKGVCPDTVVIQSSWWPQAEHGGYYQLLGKDAQVDTAKKSISGPLVVSGADSGVRLEIRAGGPANNFAPPSTSLYLDRSVTLGGAETDQAVQISKDQPVLAVFARMEVSPAALMWDPATHPDFKTIADIGRTDTTVLYSQGATYMEYLVGSGILRQSQVDGSYDGTPARFIAEGGKIAQQGYVTSEVFQYEQELPQWKRPLAWQLLNDSGFPTYPEAMSIRADRKDELAPCLRRLVPALQRSTVEYAAGPKATNDLIVKLVKDYQGFEYSPERAEWAVNAMKQYGIHSNGNNDTIGDFEEDRVQKMIDITRPIFAAQNNPIRDDLKPADLYTNEFIDPTIGLQP
jgi:hypothetical protein